LQTSALSICHASGDGALCRFSLASGVEKYLGDGDGALSLLVGVRRLEVLGVVWPPTFLPLGRSRKGLGLHDGAAIHCGGIRVQSRNICCLFNSQSVLGHWRLQPILAQATTQSLFQTGLLEEYFIFFNLLLFCSSLLPKDAAGGHMCATCIFLSKLQIKEEAEKNAN
jgi:hypothetical protein